MTLVLAILGLLTASVPVILAILNSLDTKRLDKLADTIDKTMIQAKIIKIEQAHVENLQAAPSNKSNVLDRMRNHIKE